MKDIKGYEGLYAITSCGKVWSYRRKIFLKQKINNEGYLQVGLYRDGHHKTVGVHRLVAEAYISNPEDKPQVNHKDENKTNNNINNLEWTTSIENLTHGTRIERFTESRKNKSTKRRKVYCIELNKTYKSMSEAARELDLCVSKICLACQGKRDTTGGYHWNYVE